MLILSEGKKIVKDVSVLQDEKVLEICFTKGVCTYHGVIVCLKMIKAAIHIVCFFIKKNVRQISAYS